MVSGCDGHVLTARAVASAWAGVLSKPSGWPLALSLPAGRASRHKVTLRDWRVSASRLAPYTTIVHTAQHDQGQSLGREAEWQRRRQEASQVGHQRHGLHKQGWRHIVTSSALLRLRRSRGSLHPRPVTVTTPSQRAATLCDRAAIIGMAPILLPGRPRRLAHELFVSMGHGTITIFGGLNAASKRSSLIHDTAHQTTKNILRICFRGLDAQFSRTGTIAIAVTFRLHRSSHPLPHSPSTLAS